MSDQQPGRGESSANQNTAVRRIFLVCLCVCVALARRGVEEGSRPSDAGKVPSDEEISISLLRAVWVQSASVRVGFIVGTAGVQLMLSEVVSFL